MKLIEAIKQLDSLPVDGTIYAIRIDGQWEETSPAIVTEEPEDGFILQRFNGVEMENYFSVGHAREILEGWQHIAGTLELSDQKRFRVLTYYREHDNWPMAAHEID